VQAILCVDVEHLLPRGWVRNILIHTSGTVPATAAGTGRAAGGMTSDE
jgi:hypothetical protein